MVGIIVIRQLGNEGYEPTEFRAPTLHTARVLYPRGCSQPIRSGEDFDYYNEKQRAGKR